MTDDADLDLDEDIEEAFKALMNARTSYSYTPGTEVKVKPLEQQELLKLLSQAIKALDILLKDVPNNEFAKFIVGLLHQMDKAASLYPWVYKLRESTHADNVEKIPPEQRIPVIAITYVRVALEQTVLKPLVESGALPSWRYQPKVDIEHALRTAPHELRELPIALDQVIKKNKNTLIIDHRVEKIRKSLQLLANNDQMAAGGTKQAANFIGCESVAGVLNAPKSTRNYDSEFASYYQTLQTKMYRKLINESVRVAEQKLNDEMPWMAKITGFIIRQIRSHAAQGDSGSYRILPNMVLIGSPGSGKTHYLKRLAQCLDVPQLMVPVGGMSDNQTIKGSARSYKDSRPSIVVQYLADHQIVNPIIILDELDKCSTSRHNGNTTDILLQMVEPNNAKAFLDIHLENTVDLSHVSFVGTANCLSDISEPLRDRMIVLHVPEPAISDLWGFASRIWIQTLQRYGYNHTYLPSFPENHLSKLVESRPSLRRIMRQVEILANTYIDGQMTQKLLH